MTVLSPPVAAEAVKELSVGDVVYVSGIIATLRDEGHMKALEAGALPFDLNGGILYHCGPLIVGEGSDRKVLAAGPTTSSRMEDLEPEFITKFGVRVVIGKGGMGPKVIEAMKENSCVYLAMPGGCAAVAADAVTRIVDVHWEELGMPEALWVFEVEKLGPLVVAIDAKGSSLYQISEDTVQENLERIEKGWSP